MQRSTPILAYEGMPELSPMLGRSPGVHVSGIIKDLCVRLGHFKAGGYERLSSTWAELGNALEHAIIERYAEHCPDRYIQPGELERDGIFGTPDLYDTEECSVVEIKLSWMSSKHDAESEKFWRYWVQLGAYCYMSRTPLSQLHVCHVNGNYKEAGPVYRVWEREWTGQELLENWTMLKTHGRMMEKDGAAG